MTAYLFVVEVRLKLFEHFDLSFTVLSEYLCSVLLVKMHRLTVDSPRCIVQICSHLQHIIFLHASK
uniref:Ovule protein n=1 Tax=Ascaris lumbricoides TaxID=6252 RepID=A0A0M3HKK9_ASCLU